MEPKLKRRMMALLAADAVPLSDAWKRLIDDTDDVESALWLRVNADDDPVACCTVRGGHIDRGSFGEYPHELEDGDYDLYVAPHLLEEAPTEDEQPVYITTCAICGYPCGNPNHPQRAVLTKKSELNW